MNKVGHASCWEQCTHPNPRPRKGKLWFSCAVAAALERFCTAAPCGHGGRELWNPRMYSAFWTKLPLCTHSNGEHVALHTSTVYRILISFQPCSNMFLCIYLSRLNMRQCASQPCFHPWLWSFGVVGREPNARHTRWSVRCNRLCSQKTGEGNQTDDQQYHLSSNDKRCIGVRNFWRSVLFFNL